jgi:hypothetical protein
MYLAPGTQSPVSLLELGLCARSGKLKVGCPEGFWRRGNVKVASRWLTWTRHWTGSTLTTLDELYRRRAGVCRRLRCGRWPASIKQALAALAEHPHPDQAVAWEAAESTACACPASGSCTR